MTLVGTLRPFVKRSREPSHAPAEHPRCEICSAPIGEGHAHVLRREPRAILCSCAPCAALFRDPSASGGRLRTVPDRVLVDARAPVTDAQWVALGVPVGLAFFVVETDTGRCRGQCPSPAGPVEVEIAPEAWAAIREGLPLAAAMQPDVEALLVHRPRGGSAECLVAPIDECYALAGAVRLRWRGFDGGDDVRRAVESSLERLRARGRPVEHAAPEEP